MILVYNLHLNFEVIKLIYILHCLCRLVEDLQLLHMEERPTGILSNLNPFRVPTLMQNVTFDRSKNPKKHVITHPFFGCL